MPTLPLPLPLPEPIDCASAPPIMASVAKTTRIDLIAFSSVEEGLEVPPKAPCCDRPSAVEVSAEVAVERAPVPVAVPVAVPEPEIAVAVHIAVAETDVAVAVPVAVACAGVEIA